VRATDANGGSWGSPVTVDGTGFVGWFTSLVVINGNPAISYFEINNFDLKYVRATDTNGTSWGSPMTIDSTGSVGWYTSMAVVDGSPAISYYDNTNFDLKYTRSSDPNGANWVYPAPVAIDSDDSNGVTSLAVVNGFPAVGYYDSVNLDLKYIRSDNPTAIRLEELNAAPAPGAALLATASLGFLAMLGAAALAFRRLSK
jgi:hypothetical protein